MSGRRGNGWRWTLVVCWLMTGLLATFLAWYSERNWDGVERASWVAALWGTMTLAATGLGWAQGHRSRKGPAELKPLPPAIEGSSRSEDGGAEAQVRFVNLRDDHVWIYWIDFDGERQPYQHLRPGATFGVNTWDTHPWVVCTDDYTAIAVFEPVPGAARALIRTAVEPRRRVSFRRNRAVPPHRSGIP
ncbi:MULTISPECIES: hypothetical protein [Actinomadura]|uniref:von Hippel-Lindau disease tumour suppressor beta domain-containing protein n=1 Tax=Actinomadura litoris TaxID=2678616 RepID=A0A7K1L1K8_9ACTN|nr:MULTISPECIES: hypothetical protein [Actinomadura]MBT2206643.1 hypothetical protein [Actinomadura sp. NEAU-AAG7]MUN38257.1 hypothetical protein [Actinomadura litoris]